MLTWSAKARWLKRALAYLTGAVVALGLFLRARGYLFNGSAFWLDECGWAMMTLEQPFRELAIRPIGFMGVSRLLARLLSPSEVVLRGMPWLAGMACTVLSVPLARRLFRTPTARLLFVAIISLHPAAIDLSKEFKPYEISLFLHLSLLLLTLRYVETRRTAALWQLLLTAIVGGLFAQDLIFAYPSVFLVIGLVAYRDRLYGSEIKGQLVAIAGAAGVICLLLVAQYLYLWRGITASDVQNFRDKYNVFFSGSSGQSRLSWALSQHYDMAALPGLRHDFWRASFLPGRRMDAFRDIDSHVWVILNFAGVLALLIRPDKRSLLLLLPLGVLWAFNTGERWPIGAFRTNLFVLGYMAAIACMAFDAASKKVAGWLDAVPAFMLVLLPFALLDPSKNARKEAFTVSSSFPQALKKLLSLKRSLDPKHRDTLLVDRRSCDPYRYYTEFHPDGKPIWQELAQQFDMRCIEKDAELEPALRTAAPAAPRAVWVIVHNDREARRWIKRRRHGEAVLRRESLAGSHSVAAYSRPAATDETPVATPVAPEPTAGESESKVPDQERPDQGSQ